MTKSDIMKLAEFETLAKPSKIDPNKFGVAADNTHHHREFGRKAENARLLPLIEALAESNEILLDALNDIASWEEGNHVTSSFDNPGDAQLARGAICQCKTIMEKLK